MSLTITKRSTLPGLRGTDHFGFTVPNLEEAVDFFVNVLGCEPFYELGPFEFDDDWMERQLNVHSRTVMKKLKFLRCGNGTNFEIFEYQAPEQNLSLPRNSDIGGSHLAFYVDDIDAAIGFLRKNNIRVLGDPILRKNGPSAGQTWIYFLSPWGMQLELVSYPNGKGYEKNTAKRLWHPSIRDFDEKGE